MQEISIPSPRRREDTQAYGEPDESYRDRLETTALAQRVERAESARVMALHDVAEVLGL